MRNLSFPLVEQLLDFYPHCLHVRDVGLAGQPDKEIWAFVPREHCAIVTKDINFYQRSILRGSRPKLFGCALALRCRRGCAAVPVSAVQHFIANRLHVS